MQKIFIPFLFILASCSTEDTRQVGSKQKKDSQDITKKETEKPSDSENVVKNTDTGIKQNSIGSTTSPSRIANTNLENTPVAPGVEVVEGSSNPEVVEAEPGLPEVVAGTGPQTQPDPSLDTKLQPQTPALQIANCAELLSKEITPPSVQQVGSFDFINLLPVDLDFDFTIHNGVSSPWVVKLLNGSITLDNNLPSTGALVEVWNNDDPASLTAEFDPVSPNQQLGRVLTDENGCFQFKVTEKIGCGGYLLKVTPWAGVAFTTRVAVNCPDLPAENQLISSQGQLWTKIKVATPVYRGSFN